MQKYNILSFKPIFVYKIVLPFLIFPLLIAREGRGSALLELLFYSPKKEFDIASFVFVKHSPSVLLIVDRTIITIQAWKLFSKLLRVASMRVFSELINSVARALKARLRLSRILQSFVSLAFFARMVEISRADLLLSVCVMAEKFGG